MNVYTLEGDTYLHYVKEPGCKQYSLPTGFKAFVSISSGVITNISILDSFLSKDHEQVRYQIIGSETELATVFLGKQPKLLLNNSTAECESIITWYNSIVKFKEPKNIKVSIIRYVAILQQYEHMNFDTIEAALSNYQIGDTLCVKDNNETVITLASYKTEKTKIVRMNLTTSLHMYSKTLKPVLTFFDDQFK